jgi:signal transduction histidine kinase
MIEAATAPHVFGRSQARERVSPVPARLRYGPVRHGRNSSLQMRMELCPTVVGRLYTSPAVQVGYVGGPTTASGRGRTLGRAMTRLTRSDAVDVALGAFLATGLVVISRRIDVAQPEPLLDGVAYASLVIAGAAVSLRRRLPAVALIVSSAAVAVYSAGSYPGGPIFLVPFLPVYSVAATRPRRGSVPLVALATVLVVGTGLFFDRSGEGPGLIALVYVGWTSAAILLGEAARTRHEYVAGVEERARFVEENREQETRRRVAEERLRIARDVHDSVAHSLAGIALRAGVGARLGARDPQQSQEALHGIRRASTDALKELRVTLDLMRSGDEGEPREPAPRLADLDRLVSDAAGNGMQVRVEHRGDPRPLPAAIEVAAYRIVQESLTNVARHSGSSTATVTLVYDTDHFEVEVSDNGPGVGGARKDGIGHGIQGMEERAAAVGGRLEAGPRAQGGFRVWTRLPTGTAR